ncbi:MAG: TlpA family protein disulfide reductase [Burkholderiaceae bacterium]
MRRALVFLLFFIGAATTSAQELKPFVRNSQQSIVADHQGKPFILALWSLDCPYCSNDLVLLGKMRARDPALRIVVVSTDTPAQTREIMSTLKTYRLHNADLWVYADRFTERLRHEIDPQWHGELPRLYLYDAQGHSTALSGKIERKQIEQWIKTNNNTRIQSAR